MDENQSFVGRVVIITQEFIDFKNKTIGLKFSPPYRVGDEWAITALYQSGVLLSDGIHTAVYCPIKLAVSMLK